MSRKSSKEKTYISVKDLAVRTGKTERSVRYSLELIDRFLTQKGLPLLERKFVRWRGESS